MPIRNRVGGTPSTTRNTTNATNTTTAQPSALTGTAGVQGGTPAAPTGAARSRTVPSTSAQDLQPTNVVINGFGGKRFPTVNINLTPAAGQASGFEVRADEDDAGWVTRGDIFVKFKPAVGGVDIEVESRHTKPVKPEEYKGDEVVLYLQARVLDPVVGPDGKPAAKERIITLATPFDGIINPDGGPRGRVRFHVDYDQINAWLKSKSPNLQFVPGDPLAVLAVWKKVGHQWGGFMREGSFNSPPPLGRSTAVDARRGVVGQNPELRVVSGVDKPIDITHKIPSEITTKFKDVLEPDAKLVSRREHEQKFSTRSLDELRDATLKLLEVSLGDRREREKMLLEMFGPDPELSKARGFPVSGWSIKTTDRYYAKDRQGNIVRDKHNLPVVAPMLDVYQDGKTFPLAKSNMAARFRDGEIKAGSNVGSMGKLNMKTGRVTDPFTLTQTGLEISLDTKPGISKRPDLMGKLAELLDTAPPPYSPLRELKKSNWEVTGNVIKTPAVINCTNRYKFTLEHENGMELEVSMDFVHAGFSFAAVDADGEYDKYAALLRKPNDSVLVSSAGEINVVVVDDGSGKLTMATFYQDEHGNKKCKTMPAVRFPQVEIEMDHVQARSTGPVQGPYTNPKDVHTFFDDAAQDAFLTAVQPGATLSGPPTMHAWEDLKDPRLYQDANYLQMQKAVVSFREYIFKNGVNGARQKAAQALELGGYIPKVKPTLSASLPYVANRRVSVSTDWQDRTKIIVRGEGTLLQNSVLAIDWDGFPIRIPLKASDTAKDVAEKLRAKLDSAVLYKAEVTEANGVFTVQVSER